MSSLLFVELKVEYAMKMQKLLNLFSQLLLMNFAAREKKAEMKIGKLEGNLEKILNSHLIMKMWWGIELFHRVKEKSTKYKGKL